MAGQRISPQKKAEANPDGRICFAYSELQSMRRSQPELELLRELAGLGDAAKAATGAGEQGNDAA
jgi:hypothetical protein